MKIVVKAGTSGQNPEAMSEAQLRLIRDQRATAIVMIVTGLSHLYRMAVPSIVIGWFGGVRDLAERGPEAMEWLVGSLLVVAFFGWLGFLLIGGGTALWQFRKGARSLAVVLLLVVMGLNTRSLTLLLNNPDLTSEVLGRHPVPPLDPVLATAGVWMGFTLSSVFFLAMGATLGLHIWRARGTESSAPEDRSEAKVWRSWILWVGCPVGALWAYPAAFFQMLPFAC